jgi:MFS family permease
MSAPSPSTHSLRGLDWTNFFLSDVRTGVGPFVAVYLSNMHWNVAQIGVALTVAEVAGLLTQAPGGAFMDYVRSKRGALITAVVILASSALVMALFPTLPVVFAGQAALGITGSVFGPGISAITLGLVGYSCLGQRTGRNAGFGSAGNVFAAVTMGIVGYLYSTRAIFFFVVVLSIPTVLSILAIRGEEIDYERARGRDDAQPVGEGQVGFRAILSDRRILTLVVLTVFWHLGNGAMLAMIGETIARDRPQQSSLWMSAAVTVPQVVMAAIAPTVGRIADRHGRKRILLFGFLFLPLRTILCAFTQQPEFLIGFQVFDGVSAGIFGIVGVLMVADLTHGTGHYNVALGGLGMAVGIGASISTLMAGAVTQYMGFPAGFLTLSASSVMAVIVLWLYMPETRVPVHSVSHSMEPPADN